MNTIKYTTEIVEWFFGWMLGTYQIPSNEAVSLAERFSLLLFLLPPPPFFLPLSISLLLPLSLLVLLSSRFPRSPSPLFASSFLFPSRLRFLLKFHYQKWIKHRRTVLDRHSVLRIIASQCIYNPILCRYIVLFSIILYYDTAKYPIKNTTLPDRTPSIKPCLLIIFFRAQCDWNLIISSS